MLAVAMSARPWCGEVLRRSLERRVGIADSSQILRPRLDIQFGQHAIRSWIGVGLGDPTVGIVQVAKFDGLCRAGLLTGSLDLAVSNRPLIVLGVDLDALNPLHTVGAFLHHTATANRHLGIDH